MKNKEAFRERFLREPLSNRLGELAVSLSLFASFSGNRSDQSEIARQLLDEPICYAQWTAPDLEAKLQAELMVIHQQLTEWQHNWENIWSDETQRQAAITQAREWSRRMLDASGLLQPVQEVAW